MFRSLQVKLILAFVLVGLISTALLSGVAYQFTQAGFGDYINKQTVVELLTALEEHYRENGSLTGYRNELNQYFFGESVRGRVDPSFPLDVTDPYGQEIPPERGVPGQNTPPNLPPFLPENSSPASADATERRAIVVDGELVGYLVIRKGTAAFNRFDNEFLSQVRDTLIISGLGAVAVAVVLGLLLARSLSKPLKELNHATQAMADGDLVQRVPVRSGDELGELAQSFNLMNTRLEAMLQQRERMTADIAHELRTPLSVIIGHTSAGLDGVLPVDTAMIQVINEEAHRLSRLVGDLRTLSLADSGELALSCQLGSIVPIIENCAAAHRPEALNKAVDIAVSLPAELPDMLLDPDRMKQILNNLLENALRYAPTGSQIRLSAAREGDRMAVSVADEGMGIPLEERDRIFDRLYRCDDARSRKAGGSGLGLSIVKMLVEGHGGEIAVESEPGKGACFRMLFPLA